MRGAVVAVALAWSFAGCDYIFHLEHVDYDAGTPDAEVVPIPPGRWQQVGAGEGLTCGLTVDGEVYCWGLNDDGQVGIGISGGERREPQLISAGWSSLAVGQDHACALQMTTGALSCWGDNGDGQLGDGTTTSQALPSPIATGGGIPTSWKSVATGDDVTCAIASDDTLWCWGDNRDGQIGNNSLTDVSTPTKIMTPSAWSAVSVGYSHTCGITTSGAAYCWGANYGGGLGNGTSNRSLIPSAVSGSSMFSTISVGDGYTCAIRSDGRLMCWGENTIGTLGNGTADSQESPVLATSNATDWSSVSAGSTHACATRSDGSLWCWGDAPPTTLVEPQRTPTRIEAGGAVTQVATGRTHTCWLSDNHGLACVGDGSVGALGTAALGAITAPVQVQGTWKTVALGYSFSCALDDTGQAWCWGDNLDGQLGDGSFARSLVPRRVSTQTWKSLATAEDHTCAAAAGGGLAYCWGADFGGSLGDSAHSSQSSTPVPVNAPALNFTQLVAGDHTCGREGTTTYCWGSNTYGATGQATDPTNYPTAVTGGTFDLLAAGQQHSCGLVTNTGLVRCWGRNQYGQLGTGTQIDTATPSLTTGTGTYTTVIAHSERTCARATNNTWSCWGHGYFSSLLDTGVNTDAPHLTPTPMTTLWDQLALGDYFTCGLTGTTVKCWGDNSLGALGTGNLSDRNTPTSVTGGATWSNIYAGGRHACGLQTDGSLWCWGSNQDGELGTGTSWTKTAQIVN